eukprot:366558-Chlamydomonas_euryale.AAC.29
MVASQPAVRTCADPLGIGPLYLADNSKSPLRLRLRKFRASPHPTVLGPRRDDTGMSGADGVEGIVRRVWLGKGRSA